MKKALFFALLFFIAMEGHSQCWESVSSGSYRGAAIKDDGTLWVWGLGTANDSQVPIQVGTATNWKMVSTGYSSWAAIKDDGTLWTWGGGSDGVLGNGNFAAWVHNPTQVGTDTNWLSVSCAWKTTLALKTDGSLWGWGVRSQIGVGPNPPGNPTYVTVPTRVGTDNDWAKVFATYLTYSTPIPTTFVIKTDGTLWAWGYESNLGASPTQNFTVPTLVSTQQWQKVSRKYNDTYLVKSDGTLWQNETNAPFLTQLGTDTDWADVQVGNTARLGLKTNGTLWTWGDSMGTVFDSVLPMQIGTDTWQSISLSRESMAAIRSDGSLWFWGVNHSGSAGLGFSSVLPVPAANNCNMLATDAFQAEAFSIYPNPANDILNIKTNDDSAISSLSVYNMLGQLVLESVAPVSAIDVSGLKPGNYFIKVISDKGNVSIRFIKD